MISITKEKTAKIFPNAVAVSTEDETHTFTSLISRDATFKAMTKAWRKAVTKNNLSLSQNNVNDIGDDDIEDEEDEMDGDLVDYESTDSMTSANQLNGFMLATKTEKDPKIQFQIKRSSATSNAILYNANCLSHQNSQQVWHYELCCIFANVSLLEPRHLFTCLSSSEPGLGTRLMF